MLAVALNSAYSFLFSRNLEQACSYEEVGKTRVDPYEALKLIVELLENQIMKREQGSEPTILKNVVGELRQAVLGAKWSKSDILLEQIEKSVLLEGENSLAAFAHDFLSILKANGAGSFVNWRSANRKFAIHYLEEVLKGLELYQFGFIPFNKVRRWWGERVARYFIFEKLPASFSTDIKDTIKWLKMVDAREEGDLSACEGLLLVRERLKG